MIIVNKSYIYSENFHILTTKSNIKNIATNNFLHFMFNSLFFILIYSMPQLNILIPFPAKFSQDFHANLRL